jgi:hypothetical protein
MVVYAVDTMWSPQDEIRGGELPMFVTQFADKGIASRYPE